MLSLDLCLHGPRYEFHRDCIMGKITKEQGTPWEMLILCLIVMCVCEATRHVDIPMVVHMCHHVLYGSHGGSHVSYITCQDAAQNKL